MKILIYGTGGIGGYFGARLAESGNDVTFISRGKHLDEIKKNGLQLKSIDGNYTVFPAKVTSDASFLQADFDLIILGVKSWQISEAAKNIKSIVSQNTYILPLQNGVDNVDQLLKVFDAKNVLIGFCKIYSKIEAPGIINHFSFPPELHFGALDNKLSERILAIKSTLDKAKFKAVIPEDVLADYWKKFLFICTVSGLGGLTRVSIGAMVENPKTFNLLKETCQEIYNVAIAKGINLPEKMVDSMMNFIKSQDYNSTASTQRDIMEGRPSELENFNGYIVKQGEKLGIKTPVNQFIYSCLLPQEQIARGVK